jgi:hypothetical protein
MLGALTLLRGVRLETKWDLVSITSAFTGNTRMLEVLGRTREFWAELRRKLSIKRARTSTEWKRFHLTTRSGPGGGHALLQALRDLVSLPEDLVDSLCYLGGGSFTRMVRGLLKDRSLLGKVQRIIAELDTRPPVSTPFVRLSPAD